METGEFFVEYRKCDENRSSEAAMGEGGGAQRPALQVSKFKKTGARSARARTRGQNLLVFKGIVANEKWARSGIWQVFEDGSIQDMAIDIYSLSCI